MASKTTEKFCNIASISVTETAANTLTYTKLETGISTFEKIAWIIHRIEYYTGNINGTVFNADADLLALALTTSNQRTSILTSATFQDPSVIDVKWIARRDLGAAANGIFQEIPLVKDFNALPGGGLIVPPMPIYLAAQGSGLVSASTITARLFYTLLQLSTEDYWELVEATRVLSSS